MSARRARLGVLVSGGGSNLQALLDAAGQADYPAEVACVLSNVPTAFALERARKAGVRAEVVDHKGFGSKADFEATLFGVLADAGVEWVCLAGFMRLVSADFLKRFPGRVLNIHPSLLPAFPGLHAQKQALERGVKVAGCTVHYVDAGTDTGPIIAQAAVPVLPEDDEASLSARILAEEHRLYPLAVRLAVTGAVTLDGTRTKVAAQVTGDGTALRSPGAPK
ncbi:phosphoribosylglycinamide formyltransferase [Corallococcus exiguus]|uniref:phosphoribosylglycinamide formyltransferase n=1 Tax=Corallococcus TaxID=83461 RepID=UPI000EC72927|nr:MULTISPECIES: phosphoribosylglycinamide formyltransferase [Corallococcus]NNB92098.1 phosphoribosylglycinamide formyltransferase [Corallococcus exiguus]NNC00439.1 phosphoribosylglycinamide formyltransferase [Corallococcus exiguus]NNC08774.1 phosphoribosylglycinamide formyltransferase [Corallococcus exiguus]NPC53471.1 phosphoribosylglycinamide formyltransferase [Corallococcus exiguus]RKH83707.1 phosphoribosylglycinamide formyltransferase [Corallococcus sp. AB032C]